MTSRSLRRALPIGLVFLAACGNPPPPAAPAMVAATLPPSSVIPRDVDLVLRVDLAKLRQVIGERQATALVVREEKARGAVLDAPLEGVLAALAKRAKTLWIGFRGELREDGVDTVLVGEGDFGELEPELVEAKSPRAFRPQPMRLPGVVTYLRTVHERGSAAALWVLRQRVAVLATPGEVDAVDRVLRDGPDEARVEASADRLITFAARPRAFGRETLDKYPELAALLADVTALRGGLDLDDAGSMSGELVLSFRSDDAVTSAEARLGKLRTDLAASTSVRVAAIGASITLKREPSSTLRLVLRAEGEVARRIAGPPTP